MAVDASTQRLSTADKIVSQAAKLIDAYAEFKAADAVFTDSGMAFLQTDLDGTTLKHILAADMLTLITRLREFVAWYDAGTGSAAGVNTSDIFHKTARGV